MHRIEGSDIEIGNCTRCESSRKNSRIHKTDTSPSSCSVDERRSRYGKQAEALTKALISLTISLLRGASCIIPPLMWGERSSYSARAVARISQSCVCEGGTARAG